MHSTSPPATATLRAEAFASWAAREGLATEGEQAARIGVARTTLSRVRRGDVRPSGQFIAAVLTASGSKFEELFEIAGAS